jgi:hypothetical protein
MTTTPTDIALELERLRSAMVEGFGRVDVKFAEVNGQLAHLVERGQRTDADVAAIEVRLAVIERRVWMASGVAALIGMAVPFLVNVLG